MSTRIGRRIYVTHCEGVGFDQDNNVINVSVDLLGKITDIQRANGAVMRKLGNNRITLKSISTTSKYYSMSIPDFIKHADKITE